jgi:exopolyphosphatase/guanosine-5'-triphosphate,3'-diphosphate pyrophosphatase
VRVAVLDLGSNSTRLLVAEVAPDGTVTELERRSTVTRMGDRVDATGRLDADAMDRVLAVLDDYRALMDAHDVQAARGVLTSAARDAANGAAFAATVAARYGIDAAVIDGDQEAQLTFAGATGGRDHDGRTWAVIDVGGGSTELVAGAHGRARFHASTQAGVVRQSERHLRHDPPTAQELDALRAEVRALFDAAVPAAIRDAVEAGIGVAGTPTSAAAILQELDRYDSARVHGFVLGREALEALLARLAALSLAERRRVRGLHPDRAGVIVAGLALQLEAMAALGLEAIEVSEHDLLRGAALELARCGGTGAG